MSHTLCRRACHVIAVLRVTAITALLVISKNIGQTVVGIYAAIWNHFYKTEGDRWAINPRNSAVVTTHKGSEWAAAGACVQSKVSATGAPPARAHPAPPGL